MAIVRASRIAVVRRPPGGENRKVLSGVDCQVAPGEIVMLIGPNGAGKSTLLSVLAGDLAPAEGEVWFDERPLKTWPAAALARRRAVLLQRASLNLPFTGAEVVRLGCLVRTERASVIADVVAAAVAAADVAHLMARTMSTLSGGERARVHLARVLAQIWPAPRERADAAPTLLLLDEPCASLDPHFQHAVCAMLRDVARRTASGILVTMHDLNLAAQYGDRIVALRDGRVLAEGAPREVLTRDLVRRCFAVDIEQWQAGGDVVVATRPMVPAGTR